MTDLQIVEAFISRHRNGYRELAEEILATCKQVKAATAGLIYRPYSRGEKQNGDELKDAAKILEKIESPITEDKLKALHDIIGVTAVVFYPDSMMQVFDKIALALQAKSIKVSRPAKPYADGYYAVHGVVRSSIGSHSGLLCEIQIKTVLHDAWSAKMHDLTYKPAGAMDARLGGLMTAVSSQIEGIEQQSILIRNIINGRQKLETRAFQTLCDVMFTILKSGKVETLVLANADASDLWTRIDKLRLGALAGNADVVELQRLIDEIDSRCENVPLIKLGWLLMTKLGSGLLFGDRTNDLVTQVDRFLQYAQDNPSDAEIDSALLLNIPNAFYVVGDLRRAVNYSDRLLTGPLSGRLDDETKVGLNYNRLTYLLELEHIKPMRSASLRKKLQLEVEAALDDATLKKHAALDSALMDSLGLYKIVFGTTPNEVRSGIELCMKSVDIAADWEKPVAAACRDWRLEAGWLRYFDLTNQEKT